MARGALFASVLANWVLAGWWWGELPERIPIHFDGFGNADGWAQRSWWAWFAMPVLATGIALGFGLVLPRVMVALAKSNSPWLNVPNKKAFTALPEDARVRAVRGPATWLSGLAIAVQVLFVWITFGSARVATGAWSRLPPGPSYALIAAVLACAACLAVAAHRAVRREIAAQARATRSNAAV